MKISRRIIESGIYGLAVGDALGVPYEFLSREQIAEFPCETMMKGGTHGKDAGTWSDDTSLTLATLDGLAEMSGDDDYDTVMSKFHAWFNRGEYTVDGVFDVGRATMQAIFKFDSGISAVDCGGRAITDNGNGSLMRILPAVLYSLEKYDKINYEYIDNFGALTHGHEISKIACRIYADIVQSILRGIEKDKLLADIDIHGQEDFARLKSADFCLLPESLIKSSGYVVDTLEAALWCFLNTDGYGDCVLRAVNLGSDTDTVAAVAGSIAGLYYGKQSIPSEWLETLRGKKLIDSLIEKFLCSMNNATPELYHDEKTEVVTEVVAAIILRGGKFLICQRPVHKARGLLWEFVGGKVEEGESKEQALIRECKEELNIQITVGKQFAEVTHEYSDITVHLTLFECTIESGEPQLIEHNDIKWITPAQIPEYEFCPADKVFLDLIGASK